MSGRLFKGILLLLVLLVAGLLASPISSGEHPWGSDRGDAIEVHNDTAPASEEDTTVVTPDTALLQGGFTDEINSMPTWFSFFTSVWSSVSAAF